MKKLIAVGVMLSAIIMCCSCGENKSDSTANSETTAATEATIDPEVQYPNNIDPKKLHPGSLNSEDQSADTSDRWYPDGDTSSEYFFMLTQTSSVHCDTGIGFDYCKGEGDGYLFSGGYLQTSGTHIKVVDNDGKDAVLQPAPSDNKTFSFDLTFQDNFTAYDFVSGTVYKRANPDVGCKDESWYDDAFAGKVAYRTFSSQGSYQKIAFNADHTFTETNDDDPSKTYTGKWEIKAANVCWLIYDDPEAAGIAKSADVTSALGFGENSEELDNNVWQQEFTIDESGKVTEFGVYPVYDADGKMSFNSAFFFGTEAEAIAACEEANKPDDLDDLSKYDLDGTPVAVLKAGEDYDTACDFNGAVGLGDTYMREVVEIHGNVHYVGPAFKVIVPTTKRELQFYFHVAGDPDKSTLPEEGTAVCVKAVVLKGNQKTLVTDAAHIKPE